MDGEIDLESYTISIIRINTALSKLESNENINEIKELFCESFEDLDKLYRDIVSDLNQEEVNINEYYLFFQNGKQVFPQYIEVLGNIDNDELDDTLNPLINVFNNLNKIADGFKQEDYNELRFE
ncbi:hypothetical protein [uncultured Methanobrevibacter sp.]|uniref:hypothetical protein n=1 Tax=uncultured Methanobrevibacter sp. TaxID=253161 RepID=UPI0025FDD83D|nr:hypothetical protein [uncultured Methanobrevibacter sp.]